MCLLSGVAGSNPEATPREIFVQAGWKTLLIGCVEYDTGDRHTAETTRQAALSLGIEADQAEIQAWAHEMRAWMNLTAGITMASQRQPATAQMSHRITRSQSNWQLKKQKLGQESGSTSG